MKILKVKRWLAIKKVIDRLNILFSITKEFPKLQEKYRIEALKKRLSEGDEKLCIRAINEINRRIIAAQRKQSLLDVDSLSKSLDYYEQRNKSGI